MIKLIRAHFSLLAATAILLLGSGLLGTLVALRAETESFPQPMIGLIMSGFFMGYVLGSYLCPHVIRNIGHIRSFSVFAAMGCVSVLLHGLIIDPVVWLLLRIITGICMLGMYLVIESWLNTLATNKTRGSLFAIYMAINLLALGTGQYLLVIYEIQSLAPFALIALFFSLSLVPIAFTQISQPTQIETGHLGIRHLYTTSPLAFFGALLSGIVNGAFWGMGPVYALSVGFDVAGIALFMSGVVFGGSLLQWPLGHLSDKYDRRLVIFAVSIMASGAAIAVFYMIDSHQALGLSAAFIFGGCAFSIYSLSMAHANDHIAATNVLEISRGLLLLSGIGATIGPLSAGMLMGWFGPQTLMIYFSLLMLLLASIALMRRSIGSSISVSEQGDFVIMARSSAAVLELDPRAESVEDTGSH
ncbi:MAG: MFS transporter [Candidatus Scalindua sp.]|nr:MFS transporter [Planctomycetota bacterium]RZV91443.1 MAG: MFS transporter [Candidatus Scalindua sp. SCAELEC01]GJQ59313.1 MAG: MFS transporter [Candidatus Scalindua sp.]